MSERTPEEIMLECGNLWASVTSERLSMEMNFVMEKVCKFLSTKITKDEIGQVRTMFQKNIAAATDNIHSWNGPKPISKKKSQPQPQSKPQQQDPVVQEKHTKDSIKNLTVSEIRTILRGKRLATSGRKDDLIKRLLEHQDSDGDDDDDVETVVAEDDVSEETSDTHVPDDDDSDDDDDDDDDESSDEDDEE